MSVRDHDYQQRVGERLTALETKMTVFYWLVGATFSLVVTVGIRLLWVAAAGG